ncbi:MAG: FtsH protease activity modulator HflK, partial [Bryobacteraceae bacterium]
IIVFAGLINIAAVALAWSGWLNPLGAAVTHQAASLLVMLNSLRLLRIESGEGGGWLSRQVSLLNGRSLVSEIRRRLSLFDPKITFDQLVERRREWIRPVLYTAIALFLMNGLYVIEPEEQGIIERFGRRANTNREPGLHYKLPWPIERLTRIPARRVQTVEIGFRSTAIASSTEPAAYEWNVQHRSGRFARKDEEALFLTGDQNMVEINATVHYRLPHPEQFLLRHINAEDTLRAAAESVLHHATTGRTIDALLTTGRSQLERTARSELQLILDRYETGVEVLQVRLLDVHPSQQVVRAYRDVAGASEEKSRAINEAEAYRNERIALGRGQAEAMTLGAEAHSARRKNRAIGDASRFVQMEAGYRTAPDLNETRLYLETLEQVLPGRNKVIVETGQGRRHLLLLENGAALPSTVRGTATGRQSSREELK